MKVKAQNFHTMLGHVANGCVVIDESGNEYTLKPSGNTGWMLVDASGSDVSGFLGSAYEVENFVVNKL